MTAVIITSVPFKDSLSSLELRRNILEEFHLIEDPAGTFHDGCKGVICHDHGSRVTSLIKRSRFLRRAPPPERTIPLSTISAASSGGVFSRAIRTESTMALTGSTIASRMSFEEISRVWGFRQPSLSPLFPCSSPLRSLKDRLSRWRSLPFPRSFPPPTGYIFS